MYLKSRHLMVGYVSCKKRLAIRQHVKNVYFNLYVLGKNKEEFNAAQCIHIL